MLQMLFVISRI